MGSDKTETPGDGAVLNVAKIICNVMSSAAAAKIGALFRF